MMSFNFRNSLITDSSWRACEDFGTEKPNPSLQALYKSTPVQRQPVNLRRRNCTGSPKKGWRGGGSTSDLVWITVLLREGLSVCIIFLPPLWDVLRARYSITAVHSCHTPPLYRKLPHTPRSVSAKFNCKIRIKDEMICDSVVTPHGLVL